MRINARLRQAQARRPRLGKRSQCDETLSMGALLHLFPRAHGGGAQGSASSGDCRSRRRLRDNDRSCRQTSCSHSHQGRRSAYAREHGYGRVHRQPRCTYSRRPQRSELAEWASDTADKSAPLTWPRYPLLSLPEFDTIAARDHYVVRKRERLGDFVELRAKTREYIEALMLELEKLDRLIESPTAVNGTLSLDDIRVLPLLRSAAVVKSLRFPGKVRDYFETMMNRIGNQPLPSI